MNVFVIMLMIVIARRTCSIVHHTVYIDDFVDQTVIQQAVQNTINRYTVT